MGASVTHFRLALMLVEVANGRSAIFGGFSLVRILMWMGCKGELVNGIRNLLKLLSVGGFTT